ncbi:MAG TPA: hypothetical protein VFH47_04665 [Candidatus Thermoplasmatota archaeon]|nr:hypothetical protein [Candidatus Thermoplasmatota archaeon]
MRQRSLRPALWRLIPVALLVGLALSGCADPPTPSREARLDHEAIADAIGAPIEMHHDHTDHRLHTGSYAMEQVAWSTLDVALGENGFANLVLWDDPAGGTLAFVAIDGDRRGGFTIADVTDPRNVRVLGSYRADGSGFQEVRVTPDGRFAVLNVQRIPDAPQLASPDLAADCSACLHVVNVEDRGRPRLVSVLPVELLGSHNMEFHAHDDGLHLYYVGQPLLGTNPDPAGNRVGVARLVEDGRGGAHLVPVGTFAHDTTGDAGRSFPHDVTVALHPLTGQRVAYVSHWEGGLVTFDVSQAGRLPVLPELGRHAEAAPSDVLALHWAVQEEAVRADGRVIAWSAPEIASLATGTGVIRSYDVSDPARPVQLGTWQLPGTLAIEGRFLLSPHVAVPDQQTGLLAVAHYHAGVWILDVSDPAQPRHLAYHLPHGDPASPYDGPVWWKKPNFSPDGFGPNVYMARWHDGLLWVTDRGTGLYALRYTGPVPGPVT